MVAYNRFTNDISIRFDSFVDEFLNILQRQVR
ncbi:TolQ-like translocation protein [Bordetella pertussis]|nr:TolQ-like translocation protein [Bordetella pertussis]